VREARSHLLCQRTAKAYLELRELDWTNRKYRFMEKSFSQKRASLEDKLPEFKSTLEALALLEAKRVSLRILHRMASCCPFLRSLVLIYDGYLSVLGRG
jgi:hypothetical protein